MAKATNSATDRLNKGIDSAVASATFKIDQSVEKLEKKIDEAEKEIEKVKDDIYFERGFRKFMFWATPVMLIAQTVALIIMLI